MDIKTIRLDDMKPLEDNIRVHGTTQIKHYIKSIKQFGQTKPIILDEEYTILVGNGLHKAMVEMGLEVAQAYIKTGLSKKDKRKLILADNKVYEMGATNGTVIEQYLKEITDLGDFDVVGYEEDILKSIMATSDKIEEEMKNYGVVEIPAQPKDVIYTNTTVNNEVEKNSQQYQQPYQQEQYQPPQDYQKNYEEQVTQAETYKTIICPACGEVIRID